MSFFFFFLFFVFYGLCFIHHLGTKTTWSASDGKEKPHRNPMSFLFYFISPFFFFFFYHVLCINQLVRTKTTCSASYGKERTPSPLFVLYPGTREKAINPSLSGMRPTAHQPPKIRNPPPTRGWKRKIQINTWRGTNRETLAVDANKINN